MAGSKAVAAKEDVFKVSEISHLFEEGLAHLGPPDIVVSNSGSKNFNAEDQVYEEDTMKYTGRNSKQILCRLFIPSSLINNTYFFKRS